jgi:O-antigen ligase
MDLSFTLGLELGIAIVLAIVFVWMKPEYALFFYGFALGFPDIAVPLGTAINVRVDDALLLLFLLRSFLWAPAPLAAGQKSVLRWQALLLAVCGISAALGFARDSPPALYETSKMIGCAAIVAVLPRLLQSERRLRFLIAGLMCAGIALIVQVFQHLATSSANFLTNFQELKNAATFTTWNPNTVGQAAMLLAFAAGLGAILFPQTWWNRSVWFFLATGFTLIPVVVFARGTALSIAMGYILFLFLTGRWKMAVLFLAIGFSVLGYFHSIDSKLVEDATRVDVTTGEGFSHRFDRWSMALEAIRTEPWLGYGFGREWTLLSEMGSEGRAHNAYMSVWIEVGLGGLALLLVVILQYLLIGLKLYRQPEFQSSGALLLALVAAMCMDSFALPTLYWEKLPTIALSIGVALIGICERTCTATSPQAESAAVYETLPQHSQA